ncbi:MAG: porin [Candidatus Eisenbacteria bacterium]
MATASMAGAKLEIKDGASIDLGFRVQHWTLLTQADTDGDGKWDTTVNHRIRRGRLRLNGVVNEQVSAFLQTDVTGIAGTGYDARVIDAYVLFKANPWFQLYFGENMVPANRQNITSSGALLAIDRPGTTYKSLTWGGRSTYAFTNSTFGPSDSGLRGSVDVRDLGITVFGAGPINEKASFKYYAGTYNGVQAGLGSDNERFTARGQINFFDNESGYYNSACYLGKKKTVGIGASVDLQSEVGAVTKGTETDPQQVGFDYIALLCRRVRGVPAGRAHPDRGGRRGHPRSRRQDEERRGHRDLRAGRPARPEGLAALADVRDVLERCRRRRRKLQHDPRRPHALPLGAERQHQGRGRDLQLRYASDRRRRRQDDRGLRGERDPGSLYDLLIDVPRSRRGSTARARRTVLRRARPRFVAAFGNDPSGRATTANAEAPSHDRGRPPGP